MPKNTQDPQEHENDRKKLLRKVIKERLNYIKETCAPASTMRDIWNSITEDYYEIAYNTFLNTFKEEPSISTLDIYTVLAIARYFNIPVHLLLSGPDLSLEEFAIRSGLKQSNGFIPLTDYIGHYHGYMNSFNKDHTELSSFDLSISVSDTGVPYALLVHHFEAFSAGGKLRKHDIEYRGTPILVLNNSTIYMTLTSEAGRFLILTFTYQRYVSGELYYRRGAVLTIETNRLEPVILNFVMFHHPVDIRKNESYLKGLLKMTNETHQLFTVSEKAADALSREHPEVRAFLERFEGSNVICRDDVYQIDEGMALYMSNQDEPDRRNGVMKALLQLREHSTLPDRLIYPSYTPYSRLGKEIQKPDDFSHPAEGHEYKLKSSNTLQIYDTIEEER